MSKGEKGNYWEPTAEWSGGALRSMAALLLPMGGGILGKCEKKKERPAAVEKLLAIKGLSRALVDAELLRLKAKLHQADAKDADLDAKDEDLDVAKESEVDSDDEEDVAEDVPQDVDDEDMDHIS